MKAKHLLQPLSSTRTSIICFSHGFQYSWHLKTKVLLALPTLPHRCTWHTALLTGHMTFCSSEIKWRLGGFVTKATPFDIRPELHALEGTCKAAESHRRDTCSSLSCSRIQRTGSNRGWSSESPVTIWVYKCLKTRGALLCESSSSLCVAWEDEKPLLSSVLSKILSKKDNTSNICAAQTRALPAEMQSSFTREQ